MATPPPMPPRQAPIGYRSPGPDPRSGNTDAQKVFDTVVGPNLRMRDNLIQLACLPVGGLIGAGAGYFIAKSPNDTIGFVVVGGVGGVILALVVSGLVIGILGFVRKGTR